MFDAHFDLIGLDTLSTNRHSEDVVDSFENRDTI